MRQKSSYCVCLECLYFINTIFLYFYLHLKFQKFLSLTAKPFASKEFYYVVLVRILSQFCCESVSQSQCPSGQRGVKVEMSYSFSLCCGIQLPLPLLYQKLVAFRTLCKSHLPNNCNDITGGKCFSSSLPAEPCIHKSLVYYSGSKRWTVSFASYWWKKLRY